MKKPVLLAILDGYGIDNISEKNAIAKAETPNIDALIKKYGMSELEASGDAVGLPNGQIGNSEVGHLTIGAGRTVYTGLSRINKSISDDAFKNNEALLNTINVAKERNSKIHIIGLCSPGGVHSHENHIFELVKIINSNGVKSVVHAITDGRDVDPKSAIPSLEKLNNLCKDNNSIIGTVSGRFYAMDRDKRWERVEQAYSNILGLSDKKFTNITDYINSQYSQDILDEFTVPASLDTQEDIYLKDNDVVIFANFRPDRARELSHLIYGSSYYDYNSQIGKKQNIYLSIMIPYEGIVPSNILFPAIDVKNTLGQVIANHNLKQLRIAETEKYAHVTFFMDGGVEINLPNEDKILINSPKVENYKSTPKMSATSITNKLLDVIEQYDFIILNYANPDMIGHTGDMKATIEAIEWIDYLIGAIVLKLETINGVMFLTADHGNAEKMLDDNNNIVTAHTTNKVPFICTDENFSLEKTGKLSNVAPTILDYLGLPIPSDMTEKSLLIKIEKPVNIVKEEVKVEQPNIDPIIITQPSPVVEEEKPQIVVETTISESEKEEIVKQKLQEEQESKELNQKLEASLKLLKDKELEVKKVNEDLLTNQNNNEEKSTQVETIKVVEEQSSATIVEEIKIEEQKTQESKSEEDKKEEPKVEQPTPIIIIEEVKTQEIKTEEPKLEENKKEEPTSVIVVEEVKIEEPKVEENKTEEVKVEEKKEDTKLEEPKKEESKTEDFVFVNIVEEKKEEPKVEEPKREEPSIIDTRKKSDKIKEEKERHKKQLEEENKRHKKEKENDKKEHAEVREKMRKEKELKSKVYGEKERYEREKEEEKKRHKQEIIDENKKHDNELERIRKEEIERVKREKERKEKEHKEKIEKQKREEAERKEKIEREKKQKEEKKKEKKKKKKENIKKK